MGHWFRAGRLWRDPARLGGLGGPARMRAALGAGAIAWSMGCGGAAEPPKALPEADDNGAGEIRPRVNEDGTVVGAEAAGRDPDTLVVAVRRVPNSLDPLTSLEPWGERVVEDLVFEGLVMRDGKGHPWARPQLADRCETDAPAASREIRCHIPKGRSFHDGKEVTPEDVLYSLQAWLDPRRHWYRVQRGLGHLYSVELVDAGLDGGRDSGRWIRIRFERALPLALERIAAMKIVPRSRHRGSQTFGRVPVGTGPMRVVSLSADRLVLERVREGPPSQGLVLRAVPDGSAALNLLRRGEIHVLAEVSPAHVPLELAKPGMLPRFRAFLLSPARYDVVLFNLTSGVQAGPRLRGALEQALPRARVAREVSAFPGLDIVAPVDLHDPTELDLAALSRARPAVELGQGGLPAMPPLSEDTNGAERAAATLDALEWKVERGVRRRPTGTLRMPILWSAGTSGAAERARAVREAWTGIGVQSPFATAGWHYVSNLLRRREYQTALVRLALPPNMDPHATFHTRGEANVTGVSDAEVDRAVQAYREARDPAARRAALERLARRLDVVRPAVVLHAPLDVMLVSRRVEDLSFEADLPRLDRIRLGPPLRGTPLRG